ncbi:MAG: hypothetical protein Q8P67_06395, partial [archaeon]|nr:hypothetical protein [archaeon]
CCCCCCDWFEHTVGKRAFGESSPAYPAFVEEDPTSKINAETSSIQKRMIVCLIVNKSEEERREKKENEKSIPPLSMTRKLLSLSLNQSCFRKNSAEKSIYFSRIFSLHFRYSASRLFAPGNILTEEIKSHVQ